MEAADEACDQEMKEEYDKLVAEGVVAELKEDVFADGDLRRILGGADSRTSLMEQLEIYRRYKQVLRDPVNHV